MLRMKPRGGAQAVIQITEGVIWRQLLYYFFPILFGTFFQQLYNTADAVIVGQFVGTGALAAVGGATGSLASFCVNLFVGLSTGATVVLAQAYGARDMDGVRAAVHTAAGLVLAAGLALTVCGYAAAPWALRAMDTPADILQPAILYFRIYMLGTIPAFFYNMGSGILRAVGDTRRPLYFLIVSCLVNILLDVLLVAVLRLGVAGAALATVLSQIVSAVLVFFCLTRTGAAYRLEVRGIRFDGRMLGSILRVGVPAGLQSNMYAISNILIQAAVNGFGTATVAAWTAFGKIDGFYWMVLGAFGMSITTFAGQNFGAQKYARIRESVRVCLALGFGSALLMSVFIALFGEPLLGMFTRDAEVLQIGLDIAGQLGPWYFAFVCIEIFAGVTRGCGCSLVPSLITCGGVCALRVAWVLFLLPLRPQLSTVLVSYPVSWVFTSILFLIYYLQGGWLRRRIQKMGYAPEPPRGRRIKQDISGKH
ncbi:MAG: MATE family efflux transporter [Subdoligranulum sp.]|nr:MATE family efflux transporter [Subdoligranulum sp.]